MYATRCCNVTKTVFSTFGLQKSSLFITRMVLPLGQVSLYSTTTSRSQVQLIKLSYSHGLSRAPLIGETINQRLQKVANLYPDNEFVVFTEDNKKMTFSKFTEVSSNLAKGLLSMGLQKGDRVGIWGPNCLEWVLVQYATAMAGMILVNINPSYKGSELEYAMKKVDCRALIMMPKYGKTDYYDTLSSVIPELSKEQNHETGIKSSKLPNLCFVVVTEGKALPGTRTFDELILRGYHDENLDNKLQLIQKSLCFDEAINIQFTSGTTGKPKGATLSHHNILNNANFLCHNLNYFQPGTKICIPVPLYHCFGMVLGSLAALLSGATAVFPSRVFNAESALAAVASEKCTSIYGTPTMFIDMLNCKSFEKYNLSTLRTGVMAGSQCPEEIMKQVMEKMNCHEISIVYGQTEASPITNITLCDDPFEKRVTTVGKPFPFVEIKVVDECGIVVPVGTVGELCFRGHGIMKGYWAGDDQMIDPLDDDWLHSGDLGMMDEDGYFKIVGRLKDMIIRGGENIYPKEIEEFLHKHPKVKDVQVIGVPSERLGEEVCAWIRLHDNVSMTEKEVKEFCLDNMSYFKIPKYIKFVDQYPLTVTGKVKKFEMREIMTRELKCI